MINWQVTATTIYCDAVDDEVTIMVHKDGSFNCIGYNKYDKPDRDTGRMLKSKGKAQKKTLECEGPECPRGTRYRDKIFSEETGERHPEQK